MTIRPQVDFKKDKGVRAVLIALVVFIVVFFVAYALPRL
jgi:hypothetical protein